MISNPELSPTEIRVYLYIKFRWQFFQSRGDEFRESVTTIGKVLNLSGRTVLRSMEVLSKHGYLDVVPRKGRTSLYIPKDECKQW